MSSPSIDRRLGLTGNKAYKAPCDLATTANVTLSGEQVIDGTLTSSSRVLVWVQNNNVDNGIWDTSSGSWSRAIDCNTNQDIAKGTQVLVTGGTTYAGQIFEFTSANPIIPGTSAIAIVRGISSSTLEARLASTASAADGDAMLAVKSTRPNTVADTQHGVNERYRNIFDWLTNAQRALVKARTGYDATARTALYISLETAWLDAIANQFDLLFPDGLYELGEQNFPFKNPSSASLLDCKNISLLCSPGVEFRTVSVDGADVLQLNAVKNFHVRGYPKLTATVSGSASGSNGVSITNGADNVSVEIRCENLGSLDKTTFIDGGKAFTIQPGTGSNELGTITARVFAKGCAEGFGYEPDLVTSLTKRTAIDVHVTAEDCYVAVKAVSGGASGALSSAMTSGVVARGTSINCQHDLVVQRQHGIDVELEVVSTKTAAAKRLNPSGVTWFAADTIVDACVLQYVHNGVIRIHGNKGACDYKARIGGASAGSSGLSGATSDSDIFLDIGGTAATADVLELDSGGNTMRTSRLKVTNRTASTLPTAYYAASLANRLEIGAITTGSYTGTLTGVTATVTGTIKYSLNGDVVTLAIPTIAGTSNTAAASITGMPAEIRPAALQGVIAITTDNGVSSISRVNVLTDGTLDLYYGPSSGVFTGAGTKGIQLTSVTYRRS